MSKQINVKKGSKDSFGSGTESQVRQDICGMCTDSIKQARMLGCLCSFCESCLAQKMETFPAEFECSICGEVTLVTSINDLPIDYTKAANSSRSLSSSCDMCSSKDQPESYCIDCSASMCAFCTRSHRRQIFTSKHEIECLDLQPIYCKTHPDEKVSLFCDNCDTLACRDCAISIHRGHSCNFISEVETEFRAEFDEKIDESEQKMMSLNDYLEDIRVKKAETNAEAQRLIDEIHLFSQNYIQQIQAHTESLINRVHQNRHDKLNAIEDTIADIERLENETENALDISRVASKMEGSFMLSMMDQITKRLDVLDKRNDDLYADDTSPTLRFDKSSRQMTKDNIVICGDIFVHSRAKSCHMLSHRVTGRTLTLGKAYEVNIDVSDSLDPVTKADFKVEFSSEHHTGKWKLLDKKNNIVSVRFMAQQSGTYKLGIMVDGDDINEEALEIKFGQKNEQPVINDDSPIRQRHRFQSGQSNDSSAYQPIIQSTDKMQSVTI